MKNNPVPDWLFDIEDAKLLGVKPWEVQDVPHIWRQRARIVEIARIEAAEEWQNPKK